MNKDIAEIQSLLINGGFSVGKSGADGLYGKDTRSALEACIAKANVSKNSGGNLKISPNGISFIKKEEGDELKAYLDTKGVLTIGTGHTGLVDGKPIVKGMTITKEKSSALLVEDLAWVERTLKDSVKVPLTQNQYDALCSLVFNIGKTAFEGSTLLRLLNSKNYSGAADEFPKWKKSGKDLNILLPRRQRERDLFKK